MTNRRRRADCVGRTPFFTAACIGIAVAGCRNTIAGPHVEWQVALSDPGRGLVEVRAVLPVALVANRSFLDLRFRDLQRHPDALKSLTATSAAGEAPVTVSDGVHRIDVLNAAGELTVEYTVDPTFYPPGGAPQRPSDARSRVASDLAIVRTTSLFPVIGDSGVASRISFTLPPGWVAVVPWPAVGDGFDVAPDQLRSVEYLGFGPFEVERVGGHGSAITVATLPGVEGASVATVASIVRAIQERIGIPGDGGRRVVIIVPAHFMRGGAAGRHTVVQLPSPVTLVHEIFHWWNHAGLARPDARWLVEGVTEHYALKLAEAAGLLSAHESTNCLADLNAEMEFLEQSSGWSLAAASRLSREDGRASRVLYSKGALFATLLERRGYDLDAAMRVIVSEQDLPLENDDLEHIFAAIYGPAIGEYFRAYVYGDERLPDMGLPPGPGSSGCARYLP
jgi:hypothetical protein